MISILFDSYDKFISIGIYLNFCFIFLFLYPVFSLICDEDFLFGLYTKV